MFRCSRFGFALLFVLGGTSAARAADHLVDISYWNWGEEIKLTKAAATQNTNANFSALGIEYEFTSTAESSGWAIAPALLVGQATGGTSGGDVIYAASYQKFFGAAVKATWFWRLEDRIVLEVGALALYRPFQWPDANDAGGRITAESGSPVNFGPTANLRIHLGEALDYCQSFGALLVRGSSIWSVGLGYRF